MKELYLILGARDTGKTSTIRALTGFGRNHADKWRVKTIKGICEFYVRTQSLQEAEISPEVFIREIKDVSAPNVLVSLWIDRGRSRRPALDYVEEIKKQRGWEIREAVILGEDRRRFASSHAELLSMLPTPNYVPDSKGKTVVVSNANAHKIRKRWKWD